MGKKFKIIVLAALCGIIIYAVFTLYPKDPIKIGLLSVLSGRNSQLGVFARDGVKLMINRINEQGGIEGRKIKLLIKDNEGKPDRNESAIKELLNEGTKIIIGPLTSNMAESTLKTIKGQDVIVISPTIALDKIKNIDDQFFRIINSASTQGIAAANLVKKLGLKYATAVIDGPNQAYTLPVYKAFAQELRNGGNTVHQEIRINLKLKTNFKDLAEKINQKNPDVLLIATSGIDAAAIAQQIRKLNKKVVLICSMWAKTSDVIVHGGRAIDGAYFVGNYEPKNHSDKYLSFKEEFYKHYKTNPSFVSAFAYETTNIVIEVLKQVGDSSPSAIKNKIIEIGQFEGLNEVILVNRFGDAKRKNTVQIVKNGKFSFLDN